MNIKELLTKFGITTQYQWLDNFEMFEFQDIFTDMINDNQKIIFTGKTDKNERITLSIDINDKINFLNYSIIGEDFTHYEFYTINGIFMGSQ